MNVDRVYKFELPVEDWVTIYPPLGAESLSVQTQNGKLFLWMRCNPAAAPWPRHIRIAGTGHDLASNVGRHIGSVQMHDGALVFHVFEEASL